MAVRGKSVNLFLMDGEPSGRMKCTLSNWTGIAYKIPRTALDKCKAMDILKQSGVYFLFGTDKENNLWYTLAKRVFEKMGKVFCSAFRNRTPLSNIGQKLSCLQRRIILLAQLK